MTPFNIFVLLVLVTPTLALGESQFPCFFIFGDSMADNGNNNYLQTAARVNYLPYGIDFPAGPTGRFTNGRNLVDFIAEFLGFEQSIPPFSNATDQNILRGLNYASGGAGILDESGTNYGDVISLNKQLSNHEISISKIKELLGSKRAAEKHLKSCIYYMGMGNNDYLANYLPQYHASTAKDTPKQFASRLITQYSKQLRKLYKYGGRKVAVFGVGQLGCIPQQVAAYGASAVTGCVDSSNDVAQMFNEKLKPLLSGLNFVLPRANFVFSSDISDDATSFGNITVVNKPCCETSEARVGHCVEGGALCSNRDEYYFWDEYHPTEAANLIGAKAAYKSISPLFAPAITDH